MVRRRGRRMVMVVMTEIVMVRMQMWMNWEASM